jgi:hypothetical protein
VTNEIEIMRSNLASEDRRNRRDKGDNKTSLQQNVSDNKNKMTELVEMIKSIRECVHSLSPIIVISGAIISYVMITTYVISSTFNKNISMMRSFALMAHKALWLFFVIMGGPTLITVSFKLSKKWITAENLFSTIFEVSMLLFSFVGFILSILTYVGHNNSIFLISTPIYMSVYWMYVEDNTRHREEEIGIVFIPIILLIFLVFDIILDS